LDGADLPQRETCVTYTPICLKEAERT
jgi:hypothetical protein